MFTSGGMGQMGSARMMSSEEGGYNKTIGSFRKEMREKDRDFKDMSSSMIVSGGGRYEH